jgi:hypothetical protein
MTTNGLAQGLVPSLSKEWRVAVAPAETYAALVRPDGRHHMIALGITTGIRADQLTPVRRLANPIESR